MRRFELQRDQDMSDVSGTGVVAEGVQFECGVVAMRWLGTLQSTAVYDLGIDSVLKIHGHHGMTRIVWLDDDHGEGT
jgi:hypothetical protein